MIINLQAPQTTSGSFHLLSQFIRDKGHKHFDQYKATTFENKKCRDCACHGIGLDLHPDNGV